MDPIDYSMVCCGQSFDMLPNGWRLAAPYLKIGSAIEPKSNLQKSPDLARRAAAAGYSAALTARLSLREIQRFRTTSSNPRRDQ